MSSDSSDQEFYAECMNPYTYTKIMHNGKDADEFDATSGDVVKIVDTVL
jgi:hypothetical protein